MAQGQVLFGHKGKSKKAFQSKENFLQQNDETLTKFFKVMKEYLNFRLLGFKSEAEMIILNFSKERISFSNAIPLGLNTRKLENQIVFVPTGDLKEFDYTIFPTFSFGGKKETCFPSDFPLGTGFAMRIEKFLLMVKFLGVMPLHFAEKELEVFCLHVGTGVLLISYPLIKKGGISFEAIEINCSEIIQSL